MIYYAKIKKERSGEYLVNFPGLDGCFTEGKTLENAKKNAQEALNGWLAAHCDLDLSFSQNAKTNRKHLYPVTVDLNVEFAIQLRKLRNLKKLTQAQAARLIGVSQQAYAKLESPKKSNPSLSTLQKLSESLGGHLELKLVI